MQKRQPYRNKKITDAAQGEDCLAQFPGCRNETATTVFCHLNEAWAGKGLGQKADDCLGFFGCSHCHDLYDRRTINAGFEMELNDYLLRAVGRTIRRLIDKKVLK